MTQTMKLNKTSRTETKSSKPELEPVPIPFHLYRTVEQRKGIVLKREEWYSKYGNFCTKYRKATQLGRSILKAQYV